jgi:glycosyltransferase involved in cell wall biosynthesis
VAPPLVSVVLPVRNGARYVGPAVAGILTQTCADLELIVVDDGSTDASADLVRAAAAGDPRLHLISQPACGVVAALNKACAQARGRYLARMDADDLALPQRLARQVAYLEEHPRVAVLGTRALMLRGAELTGLILGGPCAPPAVAACLRHDNCLIHPTVMMRREVFVEAGGYRPLFTDAEDLDLWLRIVERHELANLPEPLLHYRLHDGQVSHAAIVQMALARLGAYAVAESRRAGGAEPAVAQPRIDRAVLARLGVGAPRIEQAVIDHLVARAVLYRKAGLPALAEALCQRVVGADGDPAPGWGVCAWRHWGQCRYLRACGRPAAAAAHLALALLMRPALAAAVLYHWRRRAAAEQL